MKSAELYQRLRSAYHDRDVDNIVKIVDRFRKHEAFPDHLLRLVKEGRIDSSITRLEEIARVLLEEALGESGEAPPGLDESFYEAGERFEKQFGKEVAELFVRTQMPDEFISQLRTRYEHGETAQLSDDLIERYKRELVRIEQGRLALIETLQPFSSFPVKHAVALHKLIERLYLALVPDQRFLTVKPYFLAIAELAAGGESKQRKRQEGNSKHPDYPLFEHYLESGEEPSLFAQVELRIAVHRLLQFIRKQELLDTESYRRYLKVVANIFRYRASEALAEHDRSLLEELQQQVNRDQQALLENLAKRFQEEYRTAEEQMLVCKGLIESELAYTQEYLAQVSPDPSRLDKVKDAKTVIALEKLSCLAETFTIPEALKERAGRLRLLELERAAIGFSTEISPSQIAGWIQIYSILFANADLPRYMDEQIAFTEMRELISDLTTFHLMQNVTQLKASVDRALSDSDEEKAAKFTLFNQALKLKLKGLMQVRKRQEKSLEQMIGALGFIKNEAIQFLIAETFKGFQVIVDAFNATANDYFVLDREKLLEESQGLYNDICNKCLKGFVYRPASKDRESGADDKSGRLSWFGRLFST